MFRQNLNQFVKSKTNWVSAVSIVFAAYGFFTGQIPLETAMQYVEMGALGLGLRDAIA